MVLQRAPAQANIWGYVDECAAVNITFNSATISATVTPGCLTSRISHSRLLLSPSVYQMVERNVAG